MKVFKRNAVILTVLLFVCVAGYLNWSYNKQDDISASLADNKDGSLQSDKTDLPGDSENKNTESDSTSPSDAGLFYSSTVNTTSTQSEYFASVRLSREQARDSAVETLSALSTTEGASEEAVNSALEEIENVAKYTMLEAEIESLIMSKDFDNCVVYISDDGIKVTVPAPETGLSTASVARITDIVLEETDFTAEDLTIIEVK